MASPYRPRSAFSNARTPGATGLTVWCAVREASCAAPGELCFCLCTVAQLDRSLTVLSCEVGTTEELAESRKKPRTASLPIGRVFGQCVHQMPMGLSHSVIGKRGKQVSQGMVTESSICSAKVILRPIFPYRCAARVRTQSGSRSNRRRAWGKTDPQ